MEVKELINQKDIVQSLINLRDELFAQDSDNPEVKEAFWKINSCLYRGYKLESNQKTYT